MKLPAPQQKGKMTIEEAIAKRRSKRDFLSKKLTLAQCGQLLWAGQGITEAKEGHRSCPSAGATYPLELYLIVGEVEELEKGIYHYLPIYQNAPFAGMRDIWHFLQGFALPKSDWPRVSSMNSGRASPNSHSIEKIKDGDSRKDLALASFHQASVAKAPIDIVIAGDYRRTMRKYGERGRYYVHLEVAHCAQNILLQATGLGLSGVSVGAFEEDSVKKIISLPDNIEPFYIIPVGYYK